MDSCNPFDKVGNIGFVSTRFAGTDGVSLESAKWAEVFEEQGHACFCFAGKLDRLPERSYLVKEAHFKHPDIKDIFRTCFEEGKRDRSTTNKIYQFKEKIKDHLYAFVEKFNIDVLVVQNALSLPLNIPLGIAITELIAETGIKTIAHHHDFFWERKHLMQNSVWDYLNMAFPPHLPAIHHVVINTSADNQLSLRTGISARVIPNVMDFDDPPPPPDAYTADVRKALGIKENELFILQPTRVVQRKGIEHAIELVKRLGMKAKLVISHASGDEGHDYEFRLKEYSDLLEVETVFVSEIINEVRGVTKDGKKIYTPDDIYPYADLVTYPSNFEGFGNAFLEAVYFKKPIMVNNYSIYAEDIKPKGFNVIEIDGYVSEAALRKTEKVLKDKKYRDEMVEQNYAIAKQYYSYSVLSQKLQSLISDLAGC
ncbi:MAG: glycosyltransferase family 4 protein [Deltaproteobacteria bacterium]|nr:glycosyltransferase family 4 protein [Deltaproteobacteria bacterium]MBW2179781.1 glycosyltransferase family 4 protein [Deltaproteobacteria bacterium]